MMFQPAIYHEWRVDVMQALMRAHPFATLISSATGALTADHVPLVVHPEASDNGVLRGHFAAANPLWRDSARDGDVAIEVLAVFQGPHAYITPSWYPSKRAHGKVVPTRTFGLSPTRRRISWRAS